MRQCGPALSRLDVLPPAALPLLAECTHHPSETVQLQAALALQTATPAEASHALRHLLHHANPRLRLLAAGPLLAVKPDHAEALAVVADALASSAVNCRKAALQLLENLGEKAGVSKDLAGANPLRTGTGRGRGMNRNPFPVRGIPPGKEVPAVPYTQSAPGADCNRVAHALCRWRLTLALRKPPAANSGATRWRAALAPVYNRVANCSVFCETRYDHFFAGQVGVGVRRAKGVLGARWLCHCPRAVSTPARWQRL